MPKSALHQQQKRKNLALLGVLVVLILILFGMSFIKVSSL